MVSCRTCRLRQLPCDGEKPTCRQCRNARRPCTQRFNVRFSKRRSWNPAAAADATPSRSPLPQPSMLVTPRQDRSLASSEHQDVETPEPRGRQGSQRHVEQLAEAPSVDDRSPLLGRSSRLREGRPHQGPSHPSANTSLQTLSSPPVSSLQGSTAITDFDAPTLGPGTQASPPVTTSLASHEAQLLQYFGTTLGGPWFDLADQDFTTEVLALAPRCEALYFSIMALSSFHHFQNTGEREGEDEEYHQKAIAMLLTMMQDPLLLEDGAGLASAVILRLYEESKARQDGLDTESHLLAGRVFTAMITGCTPEVWMRMSMVAYWVHQRQDVFHSIMHQKPTRTSLGPHSNILFAAGPNDMYRWAKVAQLMAGDTADFCFAVADVPLAQRVSRFEELHIQLAGWSQDTWPLFRPIRCVERDAAVGRILPEIRFALNACCTYRSATFPKAPRTPPAELHEVVGFAHCTLTRLLLAMYNPKGLTLGPHAAAFHKLMEREVQDQVRALCGVARYNSCPVGRSMACLAIKLGAGWIHDPEERLELLEILKLSERQSGWSSRVDEQQIRLTWGMSL